MLASHCLKEGPAPPLVFLHGFLGKSEDWVAVSSFLPPSLCIGIDLPGHGTSPFTEDFCGAFPLFEEKIHLIGYSMGGRLALKYAARFPKRLASLTLCSTHLGLKSRKEREERLQSDAIWAKFLLEAPIDEFLHRWYDQPVFNGFKPDFSMRRDQRRDELAQALLYYSLGHQPLFELREALLLIGERDVKFRSLYKTACVIPNAGHAIHLENPKEVAKALQKRLSQ